MSNALKCPNPSCPYLFDPSRVPAGVVLTCPRCGMKFTLGTPTAPTQIAAPASASPTRTGSGPPPDPVFESMSTTVAEPVPRAPAAGPPGTPLPPERERRSRPAPAAGGISTRQTVAFAVVAVALLAGVGLTIYFKVIRTPRTPGPETASRLRELNLTFEPPESPWVRDEDTRAKIPGSVLLVYKRPDPEAYMAFGAKDYKTRSPRPSEMKEAIEGPLNALFENVRRNPIAGVTWLGQPATLAFEFLATSKADGANVVGECYAVSYKGIAYWSICWAGDNDVKGQLAAFDNTRGHFKLLDLRDQWREKESPVVPFHGHAVDYQLLDSEGIWKEPDAKDRKPTDEDPRADLLLVGREPRRGRDRGEEATLVVLVLDGAGGNPLAEGRAYVELRRGEEIRAASNGQLSPTFKEVTGEAEGDPPSNTVETPAPVVRLESTVPKASNQARLLVISAIRMNDKVVVVYAWCSWADRAVFEAKLIQMAGTLREQ